MSLKNFLLKNLLLSGLLCFPLLTFAQEELDNPDTISVYAKACEQARPNEARSSVRVRATDKAGFMAVENIAALEDSRKQMSGSDFNALVYRLVDNHLEDMAVRTLNQDEEQICVEVTGYLSKTNIETAKQNQTVAKQELVKQEPAYYLELEADEHTLPAVVTGMPPKPQPKIRDEIAFETAPEPEVIRPEKTLVFIDQTKFFDGSQSNGFFEALKKELAENPQVETSTTTENADYILKSQVLRAKVDPVNKQTFRLQMVIALELVNTETSTSVTEHQNRFILFESSEDEQKVAASLMNKLLSKGCQQLLPRIKPKKNEGAIHEPIITPSNSSRSLN